MKVAIVWNHASKLIHCSFRFERYLDGFRELGLDATVVCPEACAPGFKGSVHPVAGPAVLADRGFWERAGFGAVVAVTWHRMSPLLRAARSGGSRIVSIGDSDGRIGIRSHPLATLQRILAHAEGPGDRLRRLRRWTRRWLAETLRGHSAEDREFVTSTENSDAVILGNRAAVDEFGRFLARVGRPDLQARVRVVPFTVETPFLTQPVPPSKRDRIAAVGRWDDPQKDAPLLAAALSRYLRQGAPSEVHLFGEPSEPLAALRPRFPALHFRGRQGANVVAEALADSRVILFASRWEGSPHAAFEALAVGTSLVGPAIPCLKSWCSEGPFGTVAGDRRPSSLARALAAEMAAWSSGARDGRAIAGHWRPRLRPAQVCREMLAAVGLA